jgi:hypothetical protein
MQFLFKQLSALRLVEYENIYLPSWVPDFQAKLEPPSLIYHYYSGCFSASAGLPITNWTICPLSRHLTIHGFVFDTVEETTECGAELEKMHCITRLLKTMLSLIEKHGSAYPSEEHPFEAVWKTMAVLTSSSGEENVDYPPAESVRNTFRLWLLYIIALPSALPSKGNVKNRRQESLIKDIYERDTTGLIPSPEDIRLEAETLRQFLLAKGRLWSSHGDHFPLTFKPTGQGHVGMAAAVFGDIALNRMRLFRTKERALIGKGPQSLRVGDEICVLPGVEVPFILRRVPNTERKKLVGQAYVHGIMHGEAVDIWKGCEGQKFLLE